MDSRFQVRKVSSASIGRMQNVPEDGIMTTDVSSIPNGGGGYVNLGFNSFSMTNLNPNAIDPTDRKKSFVHHTREALPRLDNYRNCVQATKRPSLGELHGEEKDKDNNENVPIQADEGSSGHGIKLGWIQGVFIPCLLNIWGVMLFLRLSWVVAQSGIGQSLLIIAISAVVCILTTTSMSAISTNGEVKGGGIYYIISRSLGPEFGASVGVVFAFANAVAASMNTIGFCNSLNDLLRENNLKIVDGGNNDVRIVGMVALIIMVIICAVGMEWESKAQNVLIVIIVAAIVDFIVGACVGPLDNDTKKARGFYGLSLDVFAQNWGSQYTYSEFRQQDFFSVFSIFFPSVTGIQAGANISGDLKDPAYAIPKGTMLSLLISMFSYALFVVFAGGAALRNASGIVHELHDGTYTNCTFRPCEYGIANDYTAMQLISLWGPLIYAGCFAATLSTALTNLLSVPRVIQALGMDRIYPGLIFFSKGYGKNNEAYRGYVLTFIISAGFLLIAELNTVAPLISNFYLASYALINFCTFHASLIKPLGWRPTYKYYNMWLSLIGFILCVVIMFLIDWVSSLVTFIIIFALYLLVVYRKPDVNWGSSTQAQTYKTALSSALRLANVSEHVKNYRPQILVLSGKTCARPALLDLANLVTKNNALLVCGEVVQKHLSYKSRQNRIRSSYAWLRDRKIKAFYSLVDDSHFEEGCKSLMQAAGVGKLRPNVLLMGYKNNWQKCLTEELTSYFNVLHEAFSYRLAVTILRLEEGLDYSHYTDIETTSNGDLTSTSLHHRPKLMHTDSSFSLVTLPRNDSSNNLGVLPVESPIMPKKYVINEKANHENPKDLLKMKKKQTAEKNLQKTLSKTGLEIPQDILQTLTIFERKQGKGTIDVWWLYDDGGLAILLPYIISTRHNWTSCKLRIFALANRKQELELEERNMASLLAKFRIDFSSLKMVVDITEQPKKETQEFFHDLLQGFKEGDEGVQEDCMITKAELAALEEKTNRQLRLRELLLENSKDATLVVMSLPMPRKGMVSAPLYMAWLEALTRNMPPFLLIRGNQTSVLTFYS